MLDNHAVVGNGSKAPPTKHFDSEEVSSRGNLSGWRDGLDRRLHCRGRHARGVLFTECVAHFAPERIQSLRAVVPLVDVGSNALAAAPRQFRQTQPRAEVKIFVIFKPLPDQFQPDTLNWDIAGAADAGRPAGIKQSAIAIAPEHGNVVPRIACTPERFVHAE